MEVSKGEDQKVGLSSCMLCGSIYQSDAEFVVHMKSHNADKPFSCTQCGKEYKNRSNLVKHVDTHQSEPLICDECGYESMTKRDLSRHLAFHAAGREFIKCDSCNFRTVSRNKYSKHRRTEHHHNKYECLECRLSFNFKGPFIKHQKEVHNIKEFSCNICDIKFINLSNLKRHLNKHTGEKAINAESESPTSNLESHMSDLQQDTSRNSLDKFQSCDNNDNNSYTQIIREIENENDVVDLPLSTVDDISTSVEAPKCCKSCNRLLRCKKSDGKWIIDEKFSVLLNQALCELASMQWGLTWSYSNSERICLTCKLYLTTGKKYSSHKQPVGRPKFVKKKLKKYSKKKTNRSVIVFNEKDLFMQQSVSHLSGRQMHKQKMLLKNNLENQGFAVKVAGQRKIDQLKKDRVDDIFENKEVITNIGSEKNPIYSKINIVYCSNICELAQRIAFHRNAELITCKLQGDHGQGSLKLSVQFTFSNSVHTLIIVAITEESKESISTIKAMEDLVKPQDLEKKLGVRVLRTGDLQYLQLSIGIKTGNASYPCPWCNWRMTGANKDAVDTTCAPRNISQDLEVFTRLGSNRDLSSKCHGQQGEPAFVGTPADVFVPPCLHIMLGLVNHILEKMEAKHSVAFVEMELYKKAKVRKSVYQGGTFAGNEVQKIIKAFNEVVWPTDHPFKIYASLFFVLETINILVFSIRENLSDDDLWEIALSIREVIIQWSSVKDILELSDSTVKLHVLAVHCLEFAQKNRCTPSAYGEQDGEMLHRRFKDSIKPYVSLGKHQALLFTVKLWNSWSF